MTLEITNKQTCASFFPPNIKVPPEETEKVISGLAKFVAKNGYSFENLTREKQKNNPKFSFLFTGEYKDYYYHCIGIEAANLGMNAAPEFRQQYPVASQPWAPPWVFPAQQPLCISGPRFPYQPSGPLSSSPQPWPSQSLNAPSMPLERAAPDSFHPPPWESAEKEKCREGDSPPPPPPPPDNGQPWESLQYPPQQQVPWDRPPPQWEQPLPLHNRPAWQPPAIPPWNPQPPPWQPQNQPANPWPGPLPPWQRPPQEQHPPPMDFHLLDLVLETMVDNVSFEENKHKIEQCTDWALENCGDNYLRTVELGNHFCHLVAKCCANNESFTKVISFTFVIEAILRAGVENHRTNLINSLLDSLASIFVSVRESYPLPLFQCLMQLIESWGKENLFNSETLSNLKKLIEKEPNENQFIAALPESVMTRSRIPYYELSAASMFDCLLTLRADKYAPILPSYLSGDFADLHRIPQRLYDTVSRFLESLDQMEGRNHEGWVPHTLEKHNASLDTTAWLRPRARQSRRSRSYSSSRSRSRSSSRTYSQSPSRSYSRSHSRSRSRSASYSSSRSRSQSLSSRSRSRSYSRSPRRRRSLSREGSLDPEFPGLSHPDIERCPEKPLDGSNVGFQMLQKMGWSGVGKGIGAKGTGRAEPVPSAEVRNKANKFSGIGVVKAKEPDDDLFEQFRKSKSYTHRRDMDKRKQEVPVCYNCGSEKHFAKNCPGIARSYK